MATKNEKGLSIQKFENSIKDIQNGIYQHIYVLCGEEPYYSDVIIKLLTENVLTEAEKDFNYSLVYGNETDAGQIVCLCRRYPVGASKQLVVVKEAQHITNMQPFEYYLQSPAPDTILVLSFTNKSLDKRTNFYKKIKQSGEILESFQLEEWEIPNWIKKYVKEQGGQIEDTAAELLAQSTGASLRKISLEIDKLFKATNESIIRVKDVEESVGISRDFNPFELCKSIVYKNTIKAYEIADVFGTNPKKYPIQLTIGAMFYYFNQLLRIEALMHSDNLPFASAALSCKIFGTRMKEYEVAARNYSLTKTMAIISYLKDCDLKSKSNQRGTATDGDLLKELLAKILI